MLSVCVGLPFCVSSAVCTLVFFSMNIGAAGPCGGKNLKRFGGKRWEANGFGGSKTFLPFPLPPPRVRACKSSGPVIHRTVASRPSVRTMPALLAVLYVAKSTGSQLETLKRS